METYFAALGAFAITACAQAQAPAQGNLTGNLTCEIKLHNGKTTVFVNGVPRFPMAFTSYYPEQFRYKQMSGHGIHTYAKPEVRLRQEFCQRLRQLVV